MMYTRLAFEASLAPLDQGGQDDVDDNDEDDVEEKAESDDALKAGF